jgi:hypothetical protein
MRKVTVAGPSTSVTVGDIRGGKDPSEVTDKDSARQRDPPRPSAGRARSDTSSLSRRCQ